MMLFSLLAILVVIYFALDFAQLKEGLESIADSNALLLLGDSVIANGNYVPADKSVVFLIKEKVPETYNFAADGALIKNLYGQLDRIPADLLLNKKTTTAVISAGGNNILAAKQPADLPKIADELMDFLKAFKTKFPQITNINLLNLYQPANPKFEAYADTITKWNGILEKGADNHNVPYKIGDIYSLVSGPEDFVYGYEPSIPGGRKIATLIARMPQKY